MYSFIYFFFNCQRRRRYVIHSLQCFEATGQPEHLLRHHQRTVLGSMEKTETTHNKINEITRYADAYVTKNEHIKWCLRKIVENLDYYRHYRVTELMFAMKDC